MSDEELLALWRSGEADRVEFKESAQPAGKIAQAVCAFANDLPRHGQPGVVFVGVRDDGPCAGFSVTAETLATLGGLRADGNILPPPNLTVEKRTLDGCEVAVVIVQPSDSPPVRYKGVVHVRVGPRQGTATAEEERRLTERTRWGNRPFDIRPAADAVLADLDLRRFEEEYLALAVAREVLAENRRTTSERLQSLRLATLDEPPRPTNLGALLLVADPTQTLPGAYVQFLRIDGTELADPLVDEKRIAGPLTELLRRLREVLELHIATAVDFTSRPEEVRQPDYPVAALQQLAFNAVLHRNYESSNAPVRIYWFRDRVEIHSPGGPYGQVTRKNFGQPNVTDYRNPHLAEAMRTLGFVQRFGAGIATARRALEENGNPPPEFDVQETSVLAVVRRRA